MNSSNNLVLLSIALFAILVLFAVNFVTSRDPALSEPPISGSLALDPKEVKGMAIEKDGKIFTLNQKQQTDALGYINGMVPVAKKDYDEKRKNYNFSRLIVYRFNKPDIDMIPVAKEDLGIVFNIPAISSQSYMMDMSAGYFQTLIEKAIQS